MQNLKVGKIHVLLFNFRQTGEDANAFLMPSKAICPQIKHTAAAAAIILIYSTAAENTFIAQYLI